MAESFSRAVEKKKEKDKEKNKGQMYFVKGV